jgi:hypothetical protein
MVTGQSGAPNLVQIDFHHFKLVEYFISFLKSPRSLKLEFGAKSYAQNTKACDDLGTLQGVMVHRPWGAVHTKKGGATPQAEMCIGYKFSCIF